MPYLPSIHKEGIMSEVEETSVKLPIIDISQPVQPSSSLSCLAKSCKDWGFFHIINHGISKDLHSQLKRLTEDLFSLPSDIKLKVGPFSSIKTYTPHFIASPYFESIRVNGPDFYTSAQNSADVLFQKKNSKFSDILQEYGTKMAELSAKILEILLRGLGESIDKKYGFEFKDCHGYVRINNYSPPQSKEGEVEGLGMHTDMSCITILYQDQIGGLQVKSKEGKWIDIKPSEDTLVVNIGDMLQAWSNDKLRSSEHRVILKQPINRFSVAFFWCFKDEKVILAPDEVVGKGNKRKYEPFVCLDYLKFRENNEKGKFEKVGFTVRDFAGIMDQM